jgi:uncharacterized protein (DUF58 family)
MNPDRPHGVPGPLTQAGWAWLGGCVALYPAGVLLGYRVLIAVAIGGLALLLAATAATAIRPSVDLARTVQPDRVTVGDQAWGRLSVHNLSRWPAPGFTAVDRIGVDRVEIAVPVTRGHGLRTLRYPIPARRRGRLRLGPITAERRDPLGLLCRAQRLTGDTTLWVHPVVHRVRPLPVGTVPDYEGHRSQPDHGGTLSFSSLREYQPGDDPRRIHWKTTARTGQLMVREQVDTTEPTTTVVLDTRAAALTPGEFEHAVEAAASIAEATARAGRPTTVLIPGEDIAMLAGAGGAALLDRLACAAQHGDGAVATLLVAIERAAAGGALVVITGPREPELLTKLGQQRRRFAPLVVMTVLAATADRKPAHRQAGVTVLSASTGADLAMAWDRMVLGDLG